MFYFFDIMDVELKLENYVVVFVVLVGGKSVCYKGNKFLLEYLIFVFFFI